MGLRYDWGGMQSLAAILLYPQTVNRDGVPYSHAQVLSSGLIFLNFAGVTPGLRVILMSLNLLMFGDCRLLLILSHCEPVLRRRTLPTVSK